MSAAAFTLSVPHNKQSQDGPTGLYHRTAIIGASPQRRLILLDDELMGPLTLAAAQALVLAGEIAPLALVAVGFGRSNFTALTEQRAHYCSFHPNRLDLMGLSVTGQAPALLHYLQTIALPACPLGQGSTAMLGYSLSASFALQAAARFETALAAVVAISPSLWAEPEAGPAIDQALAANSALRLFLGVGAQEEDRALTGQAQHMHEKVATLGTSLVQRHGPRVAWQCYAGATHFSAPFSAICDALRHIDSDG